MASVKLSNLETVRLIYTHKKKYKEGTKSIFLSIQDLKDILSAIDNIKTTDPEKTGNGVRFYIGEYPEKYAPVNGNNYSNMQTIVGVPTYYTTDPENCYDNMDAETVKKCKDEIDNGAAVPELKTMDTLPAPGGGYDHYQLCPPNCSVKSTIWDNL